MGNRGRKGEKESMKGHVRAEVSLDSKRFSDPSQNYERFNYSGPTPLPSGLPFRLYK